MEFVSPEGLRPMEMRQLRAEIGTVAAEIKSKGENPVAAGACVRSKTISVKNKMKHTRNKLNKKNRLMKPGSSYFHMFASLHCNSSHVGYVLYRINYDQLNRNHNIPSPYLSPYLVFRPNDLPSDFCSLTPLGDYFYFVGQKPTDVFRIAKYRINNLYLNETNFASNYLERLKTPMNSPKSRPLVFVAKDNLYVISRSFSFTSFDFEMFSPTRNSWTILKPKPSGGGSIGNLKSFVVLDDTVYFATDPLEWGGHDESVLSYNLINGFWKVLSTSPPWAAFNKLHPAFDSPVVVIGKMLFGGFQGNLSVAASPDSYLTDSTRSMFMRPSLAPDSHFWQEFSLRHRCVFPCRASHCMTDLQTIDGRNVLCCVSYGLHPESHDPVALFSFFYIPGSCLAAPPTPTLLETASDHNKHYYKTHVHKKFGIDSYFDSEFLHRKLFKLRINDKHESRLITCFSC